MDATLQHGMVSDCVEWLRELVLEWYPGAFRALREYPPGRVPPTAVHREPGAGTVQARPRVHLTKKSECLTEHFGQLETSGMVFSNPPATCLSVAMAVPKGSGFQIVADYWALNQLDVQTTMPMPQSEELGMRLGGAAAFCTLDMIQTYWKML